MANYGNLVYSTNTRRLDFDCIFKGDIKLGPVGPRAVMKVERGEADIALEERQEQLQNLETVVIEVEDERVLDANVKMEVVGTEEVVEDQGADQGAVGGVVDDQQDQGDQGREVRGAKLKKEKKKKVRGDEGAREDEIDPFEVFLFLKKKIELEK